ncbi:MAG: PAS domain-containing protein [Desulfovibrio sp.]|nr:PAS domain-containing protein [Desulfovibrio sp.]
MTRKPPASRMSPLLVLLVTMLVWCVLSWIYIDRVFKYVEDRTVSLLNLETEALLDVEAVESKIWGGVFGHSLVRLAEIPGVEDLARDVFLLGLPADNLRGLANKPDMREDFMRSTKGVLGDIESVKLASYCQSVDTVRRDLRERARKSGFARVSMLTVMGEPYLVTEGETRAYTPQDMKVIDRCIKTSTLLTLASYRVKDSVLVDVCAPVLDYRSAPPGQNAPCIGALVATVDVNTLLDALKEALGKTARTGVLAEEQPDGSLLMLTPAVKQGTGLALRGWTVNEDDLLHFGQRRFPTLDGKNYGPVNYTLGQRIGETALFSIVAVEAAPEALQADAKADVFGIGSKIAAFGAKAVLYGAGPALCFVTLLAWFLFFKGRERKVLRRRKVELERQNQRVQIDAGIDERLGLGVVCTDFDEHVLFANESFAKIAGVASASDLIGQKTGILPQDLCVNLGQHASEVWHNGKAIETEDKLSANGIWHSYRIHTSPYVDNSSYLTGIISLYQDITPIVKAAEREDELILQSVMTMHRAVLAADRYTGVLSRSLVRVAKALVDLADGKTPEMERLVTLTAYVCKLGLIQQMKKYPQGEDLGTTEKLAELAAISQGMLGGFDFGKYPVPRLIAEMNERLDGSGPKGLKGDEISMPARILAIADVYCRLLKPVSGPAMPLETLFKDVLFAEPHRFDQSLVLRFLEYLRATRKRQMQKEMMRI